jgi:hypothetical protein
MTPDRQEFHSGAGRRLSPMVPVRAIVDALVFMLPRAAVRTVT